VFGEPEAQRILAQVVNVYPILGHKLGNKWIFCIHHERNIARPAESHAWKSARVICLREGDLVSNQNTSHGMSCPGLNAEKLLTRLAIHVLKSDAAATLVRSGRGKATCIRRRV